MTAARDAWTRPGTYDVAPGVHRIVCPLPQDGLQAVNVYAIEDGAGFALVDTGWNHPDIVAALEGGLASLGSSLEAVTAIICTHSHYDHYGLAGHIRARSGAPVMLGRSELGNLEIALDRERFARADEAGRRRMVLHGAPAPPERPGHFDAVAARGPWEPPDRLLEDGEPIELEARVLEARLTPGHTRGHLMFVDGGLIFGGDHLLPLITPSLGFESLSDDRALERFLASLAACRDLEGLVLPGHGPVYSDPRGRVAELEAHHRARLQACVDALAALGPAPAADVAAHLTWTRHERSFDSLNGFNQMLAVTETITHLQWLVDHGRIEPLAGEPRRFRTT